jgi:hypothetical protein
MPESDAALNELYDLYKSGKVEERNNWSAIEVLWSKVSSNIQYEFSCRCEDGDKTRIDEYLQRFGSFVAAIDRFHDESFLEILREGGIFSVSDALILFIINSDKASLSSYLCYSVYGIDKILSASSSFQDVKLLDYYNSRLSDGFRTSPEYTAMYDTVVATFENYHWFD